MLHFIKRFWLVMALFAAGASPVFGFALLGPYDVQPSAWQVPSIGYGLADDDGGPKDLGDGYRFNTPTLYYACDESYAEYFGSNGIAAIDSAFAVFNSLSNLSTYSNLSTMPLDTSRINYTAQSLNLLDIKSTCMSKIINLLGLAQPDRYVWGIHDRFLPVGGTCPIDEEYLVVQRNFDPLTYQYSSYVNGTLYDYAIVEGCTTAPIVALAVPFVVDPTATTYTAVAAGVEGYQGHAQDFPGRYFTGLTRDDLGGLRYLMATNRINVETVAAGVFQFETNQPTLIVTSNLNLFYAQALTNPPGVLNTLYPDLIITSTNTFFTNVVTTNIFAVATNLYPSVAGSVELVLVTNYTTNVQELYSYTYANLIIYSSSPQSSVTTQTTQVTPVKGGVAGSLTTNTTTATVTVNGTNGAFYILPANLCGGYTNLYQQLVTVNPITNQIPVFNPFGLTNTNFLNVSIVTYFTQYFLVANPVLCVTNTASLREGIDKINFVRVDYDSILGTNWGPVTNVFQLTAVSNFAPVVQTFRRVVTQPDILIDAKDGIIGPGTLFFVLSTMPALLNFNSSVVSSDGNGPGTIEPPVQFVFTKGGDPIYWNTGGAFQDQATAIGDIGGTYFQWGTFDGSTNAPVVYPSGASLSGLESLVFFQISLAGFPGASLPGYSLRATPQNNPYNVNSTVGNVQLQALGGVQPYTWALAPNSPSLPPGLTLSANGVISGSVTNLGVGLTYDFVAQATDSSFPARVTQADLFITIVP